MRVSGTFPIIWLAIRSIMNYRYTIRLTPLPGTHMQKDLVYSSTYVAQSKSAYEGCFWVYMTRAPWCYMIWSMDLGRITGAALDFAPLYI